ncbi:MAG: Ig-like domain-containing protein [Lachnospiraceae bacterium]
MAASVSYTVNAGLEEGTLNFEGLLVRQSNGTIERKTNSTWIVGSSASGQSYINPHNRVSVIQYNLDEIQKIAPIYSAELSATNAKSSYTLVQAQLLDNRASLVDYTLDDSYNDYFFKFTPRAQNVTVTVPMLDQVLQNVYDGNDAVTILLDTGETEERGVTAAQDIYSSTAAVDDDKKGHLKVILEQINTVKMKDTIEEYIEEKSENIADLKADGLVYDSKKGITKDTLPGSYPSNLVNKVTDKIAELQDALNNEKDPYKIIEVWTDLDDANLEMRDAIVLSMDVNEKNNIFFSEQEVEELGERISNDPELAATYQGVKNIADRQDVEELTQLRYDKLDNGEGLNSNYKLWYGASNCNFTVPANASSVYFTATLPAKYNEAEGLGHIWFDNIVITANSGAKAEVPNNIFRYGSATKPSYWNGYVYDAQTNEVIGDIDKGISNLPSGTLSDYVKFQKGDQNYASSGSNSVYLCNPTSDVYTQWRSDNFELAADSYTMSYQIKQEGKFSGGNGLIVQVHYLDATGKEIGASNEYSTNVVGNISGYTSGNMTYQCATLCYIVTGDEKYAKVAKAGLYIYLEEALQGMHSWEDYYHHGRPPYGDVFGAVQNGRSAATIGTMYAVMKNVRLSDGSPLFSVGEKRQLLVSINDFIGDLMDIRDRTVIPVTEIAEGISNWETDMAMGSSLLGMGFAHDDGSMYTDEEVIEAGYVTADGKADRAAMQKDIELPYAIRYIDNTTQTIKGTLVSEIRDDGAWPESINYHGAMLEKLASYSMGSRYCIGVDLFTYTRDYEDPEEQERYGVLSTLAKMLKYYTQVQAPRYTNGNASQPAFGDGKFDSGTNFKYCGAYWKEMYDKWDPNDPSTEQYHELARDMYGVWTRAGRPRPQQANEENMMQFFFVHSEWPKEDQAFLDKFSENQKSNDFMKYFGTYIFRNNFDVIDKRTNQYKESYVAFMAQDKATGHNHYDQGSFIMYADSIPLVIDPGMDNYWSAAKTVLLSTDSHSTVQLKKSANAYDNVQKYVNDREFYASDKMDMARIVGTCQGSTGQFQRTYAFVKDGFEAHVIWDQISGTSFGSRINFVLATKEVLPKSFTGNKITAESFNGESLDIFVLEGDTSTYTGSEQLKASGDLSKRAGESNPIVDVLRLENEGNDNYLTVLFPRNSAGTRGTLTTEEITVSGKNKIHGYKLIHNNGEHTVYVVTNDRQSAQTVTLPADVRSMMDEQGTEYAANEPIQIAANTMMLFTSNMKDEADEVANGPVISAPSTPPTAPNGAQNMGGGVAVTDENEYLTGNNDKLDMSVPGVTNAPKAEMTVDGDKVTITAENGQTVYYSVDGGKTYQQYTGSFTLPAGDNKICYFTANSTTGLKTKAIVSAVSVDAPAVAKSVITVKGLKQKLKLKNSTGAVVTYKVADKKIATVSKKGNITPKRIGTTKVTMTVKVNGAKYKLKTKIKVVKVKVSSKLTLNADKKKAITLKCAKLPSEITYRSEDKSIATVSKLGKVTGKKAGTTTIYTTVVVDEKTYELKTKVTVK